MSLAQRMQHMGFDSSDEDCSDDVHDTNNTNSHQDQKKKKNKKTGPSTLSRTRRHVSFYLTLNKHNICSHPCMYCLGVCSVFLVVLCSCLMLTFISYLPVVFLRLAELEVGEVDVVIKAKVPPGVGSLQSASTESEAFTLNYAQITQDPAFYLPYREEEEERGNVIPIGGTALPSVSSTDSSSTTNQVKNRPHSFHSPRFLFDSERARPLKLYPADACIVNQYESTAASEETTIKTQQLTTEYLFESFASNRSSEDPIQIAPNVLHPLWRESVLLFPQQSTDTTTPSSSSSGSSAGQSTTTTTTTMPPLVSHNAKISLFCNRQQFTTLATPSSSSSSAASTSTTTASDISGATGTTNDAAAAADAAGQDDGISPNLYLYDFGREDRMKYGRKFSDKVRARFEEQHQKRKQQQQTSSSQEDDLVRQPIGDIIISEALSESLSSAFYPIPLSQSQSSSANSNSNIAKTAVETGDIIFLSGDICASTKMTMACVALTRELEARAQRVIDFTNDNSTTDTVTAPSANTDLLFLRTVLGTYLPTTATEEQQWLSANADHVVPSLGSVVMPFRVVDILSKPDGKLPAEDDESPFAFIDYASFLTYASHYMHPRLYNTSPFSAAAITTTGSTTNSVSATADEEYIQNITSLARLTTMAAMARTVAFNIPTEDVIDSLAPTVSSSSAWSMSRFDVYTQRDSVDVLRAGSQFATTIINVIGFQNVELELKIVEFIRSNAFFGLFLGMIFSMMLFGIGFLSIVLIYSLLNLGVETRVFELGIIRMLGTTRPMLVGYLVTGALLFAVPAWVLGLVVSQVTYIYLRGLIQNLIDVTVPPLLGGQAIAIATLAAFLIPLISVVAPTLNVLGQSLATALNINRSRQETILYEIKRRDAASGFSGSLMQSSKGKKKKNSGSSDEGCCSRVKSCFGTVGGVCKSGFKAIFHYCSTQIAWKTVMFGLMLALYGITAYYVFPVALLTRNWSLVFYILFGTLLLLVLGLTLLAFSGERLLQLLVLYIFFFWENKAVFSLVKKNLAVHRLSNRRTSMMFAMSIGFIVFIVVMLDMQFKSLEDRFFRWYGGYIAYHSDSNVLKQYTVLEHYLKLLRDHDIYDENGETVLYKRVPSLKWTWASDHLHNMGTIEEADLETVGRFATPNTRMNALAPSFYVVNGDPFFDLRYEATPKTYEHIAEQLYTYDGSGRVIVTDRVEEELALEDISDKAEQLTMKLIRKGGAGDATPAGSSNNSVTKRYLTEVQGIVHSGPGPMNYRGRTREQATGLSLPTLIDRAGGALPGGAGAAVALKYVSIRFDGEEDEGTASPVADYISQMMKERGGYDSKIRNLHSRLSDMREVQRILRIFFLFTQVMVMIISYFALIATMTTNILNQSKEFGIMRAIGMRLFPLWRIAIAECFVLVAAAAILGIIVGALVGYLVTLQRALFTQLPLPFTLPVDQLIVSLGLALFFSITSTVGPLHTTTLGKNKKALSRLIHRNVN